MRRTRTAITGFGPDKLPYEEALRREWDRISPGQQPAVPRKPATAGTAIFDTTNSARAVSPRRRRRYDRPLRRNSPSKEGTTMPRKAAVQEPEEVEEAEAPDYRAFATKPVTVTAEGIAEWIEEQTGYKPDVRTVYLTIALRRKYQKDEDARARKDELREDRRATSAPEEDEEEAPAPKRTRTRSTAPKTTSTSTTSPDGAPKTTRSRSKAGTAAASGAAPRRSRAPKASAASGAAPF